MINGQRGEVKVNCFNNDLQYSIDSNDDEQINSVYRNIFKDLDRIEIVSDIDLQKKGIDKIIHLKSGKDIFIDEKKRRRDYGDILLEEYSDFDKRKIGWLGKNKHTDYIAYIIWDSRKLYLLPFTLLQMAWIRNYFNWLGVYKRRFAMNNGYKTSFIAIPVNTLIDSIVFEMNHYV